jgi:hypothetical protein
MRMPSILALALLAALLPALPAAAQIGTPGNAPLAPGGPRQGLGPPSITDHVPDIRLRSDGGGIPGAGPPIDYGARPTSPPAGPLYVPRYGAAERRPPRATGRHCETPRRSCALASRAFLGAACTCRLPGKSRARGYVVP